MKKSVFFLLLLPLLLNGLGFILPEPPLADAARIGGGRSFGGSPGFSRSILPPPQSNRMQQQTGQGPAMGAAPLRAMPGGFLGPLLAGSLLGALFLGEGGGHMGMVDILVIVGLLLLARRFFSRKAAPEGAPVQRSAQVAGNDAWQQLGAQKSSGAFNPAGTSVGDALPPDFDQEKFMEGAKLMYARLQESWDKRDLRDIREFTTPAMFQLLKEQAAEDPEPSHTDILTIEAELYSFTGQAGTETIAVYFNALLREYAGKAPENAREVWHFAKSKGNWKLDGIQQVAD